MGTYFYQANGSHSLGFFHMEMGECDSASQVAELWAASPELLVSKLLLERGSQDT
jgi:hypothetical protein